MILNMKRGFTLIELLVVMAIIAVLAAVGMASYRSANERARNSRRAADLEQVRAALEMYRTDNPTYPSGNFNTIADLLRVRGYLGAVPTPPPPGPTSYSYCTDGTAYMLCAEFEGSSSPASCTAPPSGCSGDYGVRNP
jgi:type II secretion system protein G